MKSAPQLPITLKPGVESVRIGRHAFVVTNPAAENVWEIGADERQLLYLLQKLESVEEVSQVYSARFKKELVAQELLGFLDQLERQKLIMEPKPVHARADSTTAEQLLPEQKVEPRQNVKAAVKPAPAELLNFGFDVLASFFGWTVNPTWSLCACAMFILGISSALFRWDPFLHDLFAWSSHVPIVVYLIGVFSLSTIVLNLPRMLYLGLACRELGGRVRSFRLGLWQSAVPIFKIDIGDSPALWSFTSRWQFTFADFVFQIAWGSAWICMWTLSAPGASGGKFSLLLFLPFVAATFMQCNIFLHGSASYWALCGVLEDWRLMERARAEAWAWITGGISSEPSARHERLTLRIYGLGYYLYRAIFDPMLLGLIGTWLVNSFQGIGAVAFATMCVWWFREALTQAAEFCTYGSFFFLSKASRSILMSADRAQWSVHHRNSGWIRWSSRLILLGGIIAVGFAPYRHDVSGECRLVPVQQRAVRTQINDEVERIYVAEGDLVEAGQLIATLSGRQARHDVAFAEATLDDSRAQLQLLKSGYRSEDIKIADQASAIATANVAYYTTEVERQATLLKDKATSSQVLERVKNELDKAKEELIAADENHSKLKSGYRPEEILSLEAQVRGLEEKLRYAKECLELTQIKSPISGRVASAYLPERQGQSAKAGTIIALIQDDSKLMIEIAAEEATIMSVKPGMKVDVRLDGQLGELQLAKVTTISPVVENSGKFGMSMIATEQSEYYAEQNVNSRLRSDANHVRVYAAFCDKPEGLAANMTGFARVVIREDDVLWNVVSRPLIRFVRTDVWSWLP